MTARSQPRPLKKMKLLPMILSVLIAVAVPLATASTGPTMTAAARDVAVGRATIVWGNPFSVPTTAYGNGWEKMTVRGSVDLAAGANGYYSFQFAKLLGKLHAAWVNASDTYVLDASFSGISDYEEYSHYYPIRLIRAANALEATGIESTGTLTINGKPASFDALAALTTAIPGYSGFRGSYPSIYVVFYISSELMITIGWSQGSQTIRGIFHPACSSLIHVVRLASATRWW
jgi:hypothetical protein